MRNRSEYTLRNQRDFNRVYKQGKSRGSKFSVILYRRNGLGHTRTAFVASKKVGNSVERNRARRLMRAAYRSVEAGIAGGYDIVFVARATINGHKEPEVERCLRRALEESGLLRDRRNNNEE